MLEMLVTEWRWYHTWVKWISSLSGDLDDQAYKERFNNDQGMLPHTPTVKHKGILQFRNSIVTSRVPEIDIFPAIKDFLNKTRPLKEKKEPMQKFSDAELLTELLRMGQIMDLPDDHLAKDHICGAEMRGDRAGCSRRTQGVLRKELLVPLHSVVNHFGDDAGALMRTVEDECRQESVQMCQAGPKAAEEMLLSFRSARRNGIGNNNCRWPGW